MKKILLILAIFIVIIANAKEAPLLVKTKVLKVIPRIEKGQLWIFHNIQRDIVSGDSILHEQPFTKLVKVVYCDKDILSRGPIILAKTYRKGECAIGEEENIHVVFNQEDNFRSITKTWNETHLVYNKKQNKIHSQVVDASKITKDDFMDFLYILLIIITINSFFPKKEFPFVINATISGISALFALSEYFMNDFSFIYVIFIFLIFASNISIINSLQKKEFELYKVLPANLVPFVLGILCCAFSLFLHTESMFITASILQPFVLLFLGTFFGLEIYKYMKKKNLIFSF